MEERLIIFGRENLTLEILKIGGVTLRRYDSLESTNKTALKEKNAPHLLTIVADTQNGGKGRMGRQYFSYDGGLYMSVVLELKHGNIPLNLYTPGAAVAVCSVLKEKGITDLKIKWVNDLYLNNRKVCGILTECSSDNGKIERVVVGIGINLTPPKGGFPDCIKDKAGCVGYDGDKIELAVSIAKRLESVVKLFPAELVNLYSKDMAFIGEKMTVTDYSDGNKKLQGILLGVNDDCFLRIRLEDGNERLLSSGEIF